ncbi:hypothetical protein EYF80_045978 [Liparis tanakae]|uniref:Uncharacterized protein n=1 Tax=Liparis tanakae TaxID=230148 RepID=A0A4Z2FTV3_9TELE|nr:hypothetical protein EYF80_045978 [Liparis tanakae]
MSTTVVHRSCRYSFTIPSTLSMRTLLWPSLDTMRRATSACRVAMGTGRGGRGCGRGRSYGRWAELWNVGGAVGGGRGYVRWAELWQEYGNRRTQKPSGGSSRSVCSGWNTGQGAGPGCTWGWRVTSSGASGTTTKSRVSWAKCALRPRPCEGDGM